MPLFDIQTENGTIITVDHPQAPTMEEAQALINNVSLLSSRTGTGQTRTREEAADIASQRAAFRESQVPSDVQEARGLNEALRQANLENVYGGIPGYGSPSAIAAGYKTGQDVLGENIAGKTLGGIFGTAMGLGTVFNPITKAASNVPVLAQATGEDLGTISKLGLDADILGTSQAMETVTGERGVLEGLNPTAYNTGSQALDTLLNTNSEFATLIRKDPVNAALIATAAKNPKILDTIKGIPKTLKADVKAAINKTTDVSQAIKQSVNDTVAKRNAKAASDIENVVDANKTLSTLTKFSASEINKISKLNEGKYAELLPDIKADFKKGSGVDGFLNATEGLVNESSRVYKPIVRSADSGTYLNRESLIQQIDSQLTRDVPNPIKRAEALKTLESDLKTISTENLIDYARDKNREVNAYYKNPDINRADSFFAAKAARDVYSAIIKQILVDKNVDPSLYSRTGNLMEISDEIGGNYSIEVYKQAQLEGKPFLKNLTEGTSGAGTIKGGVVKGLKSAAAPYFGGEPKFFNDQINRMFSQVKKGPSKTLSERLQQLVNAQEELGRSLQKPTPSDPNIAPAE